VSTGVAHLLVEVSDRGLVHRTRPDAVRLETALREVGGQVAASTRSTWLSQILRPTRFFNPTVGVCEDPTTGSAAGPLASQLVALGVVADGSTMIIEQGYAIRRPSRIQVAVLGERVRGGGAKVVVAEGRLQV
jgi:trans-2,3-dihydro-3-hydroxyanthranilate isomerase